VRRVRLLDLIGNRIASSSFLEKAFDCLGVLSVDGAADHFGGPLGGPLLDGHPAPRSWLRCASSSCSTPRSAIRCARLFGNRGTERPSDPARTYVVTLLPAPARPASPHLGRFVAWRRRSRRPPSLERRRRAVRMGRGSIVPLDRRRNGWLVARRSELKKSGVVQELNVIGRAHSA
jgi:hypothetical protein